jgi:allophanate hydrolase subunit 1
MTLKVGDKVRFGNSQEYEVHALGVAKGHPWFLYVSTRYDTPCLAHHRVHDWKMADGSPIIWPNN